MKQHPNKQKDLETVVKVYLATALNAGLANTPCYFIKDEMTDLIMFASKKLDDTDLFDDNLVPSEFGFAYFEKPLQFQDVRNRTLLGNILVWQKGIATSGKSGVVFTIYNDARRTPDEIAKILLSGKDKGAEMPLEAIGRFHWLHSMNIAHGQVIGEATHTPDEEQVEELRLLATDDEGKDFINLTDEQWEEYKKTNIYPFTNIKRVVHTYFLIMSQTLTAKTTERGDRAQRRRQERAGMPSEVLVIQFRKTRYTSEEGGEERNVNWSHRWIVGGHWRWQPYKDPASGGEIKKRIWISPYVKGPDDKPLKTKERVYVLAK